MTQTTKQIKSYGRIDAMEQAEIVARQTLPGAVAVSAAKAATTKAEREMISRHPEQQTWIVTIEYDLMKAVEAAR